MASNVPLVKGVAESAILCVAAGDATDTVSIGTITYEFVATPTDPYDVDIGGTPAASATNLAAAINGGAGAGTAYGTGTVAHPDVTATVVNDDEITLTARVPGAQINGLRISATPNDEITVAAGGTFGAIASEEGGSGSLSAWALDLLASNQVNSELQVELKKLTEAAD